MWWPRPERQDRGQTSFREWQLDEEFSTKATVLHLDAGSPDDAQAIREAIDAAGGLHDAAAPMGAWWQKGPAI